MSKQWAPPPTIELGGETWRHFPESDNCEIGRRFYVRGRGDKFRCLRIDDRELKQLELSMPKLKALAKKLGKIDLFRSRFFVAREYATLARELEALLNKAGESV